MHTHRAVKIREFQPIYVYISETTEDTCSCQGTHPYEIILYDLSNCVIDGDLE